jgi:K+-transporting ATPase A subunit
MNGTETRFGVNGSSLFGISATSSADGAGAGPTTASPRSAAAC